MLCLSCNGAKADELVRESEARNYHYNQAAQHPSEIAALVGKINPAAWDAWLASRPESENIEDLRHLSNEELRAYWAGRDVAQARKQEKDDEEEFHRKRGKSKTEHKGEWPKAKE
jgi:hypothetical protein